MEQKDFEIEEMKTKCSEMKSLEDKVNSLQDDLEKTQKMVGFCNELIASTELSSLLKFSCPFLRI